MKLSFSVRTGKRYDIIFPINRRFLYCFIVAEEIGNNSKISWEIRADGTFYKLQVPVCGNGLSDTFWCIPDKYHWKRSER